MQQSLLASLLLGTDGPSLPHRTVLSRRTSQAGSRLLTRRGCPGSTPASGAHPAPRRVGLSKGQPRRQAGNRGTAGGADAGHG